MNCFLYLWKGCIKLSEVSKEKTNTNTEKLFHVFLTRLYYSLVSNNKTITTLKIKNVLKKQTNKQNHCAQVGSASSNIACNTFPFSLNCFLCLWQGCILGFN